MPCIMGNPCFSLSKMNAARYQQKDVVIRADRNTRAGAVLKVFDAARQAEFDKVTVIVETLSQQRQQELQQISDQQKTKENETTQNLQ